MSNFQSKIEKIGKDALIVVREKVSKHGKIVLLAEEDNEEFQDTLYEIPYLTYVGKHGDYREYAILSIEPQGTGIKVTGYEKGEGGDVDSFQIEELDSIQMAFLADFLNEMN